MEGEECPLSTWFRRRRERLYSTLARRAKPWKAGCVSVGKVLFIGGIALAAAACDRGVVEVDHPFYLMSIEDPREVALFRCPGEPGVGCAIDGLPAPRIVAAGADQRHVVVAQQRASDASGRTSYYYFARVPEESRGWGNNPERIIGPLDEEEFALAKANLRLPDLSVRP